jgi:hypothetical protein
LAKPLPRQLSQLRGALREGMRLSMVSEWGSTNQQVPVSMQRVSRWGSRTPALTIAYYPGPRTWGEGYPGCWCIFWIKLEIEVSLWQYVQEQKVTIWECIILRCGKRARKVA